MSPLPFLLIFTVPLAAFAGSMLQGLWTFVVPLYVFVLVPVLDRVIGDNRWNPREELDSGELDALADRPAYRRLLYAYTVVEYALVARVLLLISGGGLRPWEWIGLALSLGIVNGAMGITIAHELMHRRSRLERGFAVALLLPAMYPHFRIEHVRGHHANVGTPDDPASARKGQSVYSFWLQSVVGSVRSAWRLEAGRLGRRGKAVASPRNRIVVYVGLELAILVSIWILLGAGTAAFFVFQAVVAFSLLEIVNYVEHYGLRRRYDGRRYERVSVEHSWDSPRRLTNYFLINLQRHPDHHMGPQHRYQLLSHTQESPRLPGGYAGMALLALVPPLWYRAIDPILERYDGRHESERA